MTTAGENPPVRSFMDDPSITWRYQKPDFSTVNEKYMKERSRNHAADSLEKLVENLVKTWEMESTHKVDLNDWGTIVPEKYHLTVNGISKFDAKDNVDMGNYIMLMWDSPLFDASKETSDSALKTFKKAFPGGFAWEVLDVQAGPPSVTFTWRHWTDWTGPYKDVQPTGENLQLFGSCIATVTDDLKITDLQVYYDPNPLMASLMGWKKFCPAHNGQ